MLYLLKIKTFFVAQNFLCDITQLLYEQSIPVKIKKIEESFRYGRRTTAHFELVFSCDDQVIASVRLIMNEFVKWSESTTTEKKLFGGTHEVRRYPMSEFSYTIIEL